MREIWMAISYLFQLDKIITFKTRRGSLFLCMSSIWSSRSNAIFTSKLGRTWNNNSVLCSSKSKFSYNNNSIKINYNNKCRGSRYRSKSSLWVRRSETKWTHKWICRNHWRHPNYIPPTRTLTSWSNPKSQRIVFRILAHLSKLITFKWSKVTLQCKINKQTHREQIIGTTKVTSGSKEALTPSTRMISSQCKVKPLNFNSKCQIINKWWWEHRCSSSNNRLMVSLVKTQAVASWIRICSNSSRWCMPISLSLDIISMKKALKDSILTSNSRLTSTTRALPISNTNLHNPINNSRANQWTIIVFNSRV